MIGCRNAQDASNAGGNNVNNTSLYEPIYIPSYHEVLQAASVINQYVQNINDPLACKVEAVLSLLGHQTHYKFQSDKVDCGCKDN